MFSDLVVLDEFELRNRRKSHKSLLVLLALSEPRTPAWCWRLAESGLEISGDLPHTDEVDELRVSSQLLPAWIKK